MKVMSRKLLYCLILTLISACSDTSSRYRDLRQLELPPALPIEHTHTQPALVADDMTRTSSSPLAGLMAFQDDDKAPILTLKTRPERAWDMIVVALKIANVKVLDKNREARSIQVRFDPDTAGKEESIWDLFAANNYDEADYTITMAEGIMGVRVEVGLNNPKQLEFGKNASPELLRFLHKVIDEKIINRQPEKTEE